MEEYLDLVNHPNFYRMNDDTRKGVKEASILVLLDHFDIVKDVSLEYMHQIYINTSKRMLQCSIDGYSDDGDNIEWSLDPQLLKDDFLNLKIPSSLVRNYNYIIITLYSYCNRHHIQKELPSGQIGKQSIGSTL